MMGLCESRVNLLKNVFVEIRFDSSSSRRRGRIQVLVSDNSQPVC